MRIKLTSMEKIQYAMGNYGKSLLWNSLELFLLFYLTDVLGISPATAGLIVLVGLVWSGALDPIVGYLIDNRIAKGGSYLLFLRLGGTLSALSFIAIFLEPFPDSTLKVTYVLVIHIIFRTFYTIFDVPHNAMLSRFIAESHEQTSLSAQRLFFSTFGSMTVALAISPVLLKYSEITNSQSIIIFTVTTALCSIFFLNFTLKVYKSGKLKASPKIYNKLPIKFFLKEIFFSKHFRYLFIIASVTSFFIPIFSKLLIYYSKYNLSQHSTSKYLLFFMIAGQLCGLPVWTKISLTLSKSRTAIIAHQSIASAVILLYFWGSTSSLLTIILVFMAGFAIGGTYMMVWAIVSEAANDLSSNKKYRLDGGCMAFLTFFQKISIGLSIALASFVLEFSGFNPNLNDNEDNAIIIKNILCITPLIGAVICWYMFRGFKSEVHHNLSR